MELSSSTTLEQRSHLTVNIPCFSSLSPGEIAELAELMKDVHYRSGDVIVKQNDILDCVYLIVAGRTEVTVDKVTNHRKEAYPVCVLSQNETIGLSKTGFFSTTGLRVATVTALTDVHLLRIDLYDLHQFLKKHPFTDDKMQSISEKMLYMNFIKQADPFACLTPEAIQMLAKDMGKKNYAPGEVIFNQGDMGDYCYLIASGEVEIVLTYPDGKTSVIATLEALELFGEQALLTESPRNATVRAVKPSTLLSLNREQFTKVFRDEERARQDIVGMMMERQRPTKKEHVLVYEHQNADGELIITLKDTINRNYYRLSPQGLFVWQKLDGDHSIQDITLAFFKEFKQFSPQLICNLIVQLAHDGFVNIAAITLEKTQKDLPLWIKGIGRIKQVMEYKVALNNTDQVLTKWYNGGVHWVFTWPVQVFGFLLFLVGIITFVSVASHVSVLLQNIKHVSLIFVYFFIADMLIVPLHELAHAFTTKYFGREVNQFGAGWFWIGPIAFADTSDMWLCRKWPRIIVNFAGLYLDAILAGLAAILAYLCQNPHLGVFLWLYAAVCYYNFLANLNPTQEFDGYYILMDMLDKPNLREAAIVWLIKDFPHSFKSPRRLLKYKDEIIYWVAAVLFLLLVTYVAYLFQTHVVQYLLPHAVSGHLNRVMRWLLPLIAVVLSIIGIVGEVRKKALRLNKIKIE